MKDLMVHLDDRDAAHSRLTLAVDLAKRFGARLTGLFARLDTHHPSIIAQKSSDELNRHAEAAKALFDEVTAAAGVKARWWQLPYGTTGLVVSETVFCARYFNLVIMGQHDPAAGFVTDDLVEQVLLNCGRPVLVIPHLGTFKHVGERAVIAWNAGREAARAVQDALPLLRMSKDVAVISMRDRQTAEAIAASAAMPHVDILDHLSENGISVHGERLPQEEIGKIDMLLSRACDLGADLLIMGGHGHYGFPRLKGSATRQLLKQMTLPVLLSH